MPRQLVILGTGPHAREMAHIVDRINAVEPEWELIGFVSERISVRTRTLAGRPILGRPGALDSLPDASLAAESEWWQLDVAPRERFVSLVDPSCFVAPSARIGHGCVVYPHGFVGADARLEDFVFCLAGCTVNHEVIVEERAMLASGVTLAGRVQVGRGAYVGQSATVRQDLTVGARSFIGMGSAVVRDVADETIVAGVPARVTGDVRSIEGSPSGMGSGEFRRLHGA